MRTNLPFLRKIHLFSVFGILSTLVISCGSYQNTSYYDNDGVYGSYERPTTEVNNQYSEQNIESSNRYAQQFRNMQDDYAYFTDVDEYTSQENDTVVTVYKNNYSNNQQYAGWGNNGGDVTVNYYNSGWWGWNNWYSPYWGWGGYYSPYYYGGYYGNWGWNSWYGPSWGLGWGWNSWYGSNWGWGGYYNPYYYGGYYGNYYNGYYRNGRNVVYNNGP